MENDHSKAVPTLSVDWSKPARTALVIIFVFFGIGGGWAALAPLDSAVQANGTLEVESQRKAVQHFEGGILAEIHVRDGDVVREGQLLFVMDATQPRATLEILENQLAAAVALEARLLAERDRAESVEFPVEVVSRRSQPVVKQAIDDQVASFNQRRAALNAQIDIAQSRILQTEQEIVGLSQDRASNERQIALLDDQLKGLRTLLNRQLVSVSRVKEVERERERLSGLVGRNGSDIAKAEQLIGEMRNMIRQVTEQFHQQVGDALVEVRKVIAESRQKVSVASDVLRRLEVRAPQAGVCQNRKFSTIGAVVKPGDVMVEIAPLKEKLVVAARVAPLDVDSVALGQTAEIRFPAFPHRRMPIVLGKVRARSNDVIVEPGNTQQPAYYRTEVEVDVQQVPEDYRDKLVAGMPANVVVSRGPRTPLEYLFEPITDRLRTVMREK